MIKKTSFIWPILLFCFVLCETGLSQSQSEYALIQLPVLVTSNPPDTVWKMNKSDAASRLGTQLFIDQASAAIPFIMTPYPPHELVSGMSFHLDNGWNRVVYLECMDSWIRSYGDRGSGTEQFLWPSRLDARSLVNAQYLADYYYIYVADKSNNRIVELRYHWGNQEMEWMKSIEGGGLDLPEDLDINNGGTFPFNDNDYLWVVNGQQIKRFTVYGLLANTYGYYDCNPNGVGNFCRPTAVACGRSNWLEPPYEKYANDNRIYVADNGNHRLVWMEKDSISENITWIKSLSLPSEAEIVDLEVDNFGQVWAADKANGRIYKYTSDLYPLCYFGSFGTAKNQFYYPGSIANSGGYLGGGNVFVTESWTDSSGGQYFTIGTDVLDFEVISSVDYVWHYINYTLADPSHVTIKIYNQANQLVKTLFAALEYSGACTHVWDGTDESGDPAGTGDYRIVLTDSSTYGDPETEEPVNVVTKETWFRHSYASGTAPSSLIAYQSGPDKVTLEWDSSYAYFTVYCDGCLCGSVGPYVTTYVDSGLVPGRTYVYWVRGYSGSWESPPSNADTVFLSPSGSFTPPPELPIANDASPLPPIRYDTDYCDLAIEYTIGHPGHFAEIEVLLRNLVKVCGFNFLIRLRSPTSSHPELANFRAVNICQDSILIESDWVHYPVRECFIDTAGALVSDFHSLSCRGQVGDTTEPDCNYLWVQGWADPDHCIEESGSYRALFKFGLDLSCIWDADTLRSVFFDIPFGYLVDHYGQVTSFEYWPPGELFAWWSVPGDANNDFVVDAGDVLLLVNYLFLGTSGPCIPEAGDPDSSCVIDVGDIIYLGNYLYSGTAPPRRGCVPCPGPKEEKQASILSK